MSKPLFKSEDDAVAVIERCIEGIKIMVNVCDEPIDMVHPVITNAIGRSLMQHIYDVCEALLYIVCFRRIGYRKDVTEKEWPKIHEMRKCYDEHNYIDCYPLVCEAADEMAKHKKACDKRTVVTPQDLKKYLEKVAILVEWLVGAAKRSGMNDCYPDTVKHLEKFLSFINGWLHVYEKENMQSDFYDDYKLSFRYYEGIDIDSLADEEEDEYYRPRKGNKRESMAPLFIYLILQRFDKDNRAHVSDIQAILEEEYEIELSRGAVERALNTMVDGGDVNVWSGLKRGSGYWYSEKDENEEIE